MKNMKENNKVPNSKTRHIAWKDRIGLSDRWEEAIKGCYYNWNQPGFTDNLDALEHLLVNVQDGPQLRTELKKFKKDQLQKKIQYLKNEWLKKHSEKAENPAFVRDIEIILARKAAKITFSFIIQLLEDNNFGFYKSEYDGEYDIMS